MTNKKLKRYRNSSGLLIPFSLKKNLPFICKRIFIIYGKKNSFRGNHAHYKCSQFLYPLYGSVNVEYENKSGKFKKKLSFKKNNSLLLKPKTWCRIHFINKNSKILVFCDREYEFSDYIEEYDNFLKVINKK